MHISNHMHSKECIFLGPMENNLPTQTGTVQAVRVLFVEVSDASAAPVVASLEASDRALFRIARVAAVADAKRSCMSQSYDLILVGSSIEDPADLEPIRALAAQVAATPIVLLADLPSAPLAHH